MDCHFLLQGIFPTQESNPGLLHCRQTLYRLSHQGRKKGNAKECSNYHTITFISHTSKVMLKILQARLQQYVNWEPPDVQAGLEKAEKPEIKLSTSVGWLKKQLQKNIYFIQLYCLCQNLWLCESFSLCGSQQTGKFLENWEYLTTLPVSWETCIQAKKQQILDMEQLTSSKLGKEYKAVYCHPAYLTYMQSTSCEMLGWMKHTLESRLLREISTTDMQMIPL